ncbi:hypothetical protein ACFPMF_15615 [Larkinella bovis]|uniref:Uncharacterized protein n=1 Tax=Larkinella bovis TaxID=683041 RepID=A0ABW0IDW5_9BACT
MTIISDYLFIQTKDGLVCRVPVQLPGVETPLQADENTAAIIVAGLNVSQWVGKTLHVTIVKAFISLVGWQTNHDFQGYHRIVRNKAVSGSGIA